MTLLGGSCEPKCSLSVVPLRYTISLVVGKRQEGTVGASWFGSSCRPRRKHSIASPYCCYAGRRPDLARTTALLLLLQSDPAFRAAREMSDPTRERAEDGDGTRPVAFSSSLLMSLSSVRKACSNRRRSISIRLLTSSAIPQAGRVPDS